jgi:hypothetical protein
VVDLARSILISDALDESQRNDEDSHQIVDGASQDQRFLSQLANALQSYQQKKIVHSPPKTQRLHYL